VIEDSFRRMAAGEVELMPRRRLGVEGGYFAVMAARPRTRGAGLKSYTVVDGKLAFVVCLFDLETGELRPRSRQSAGPDAHGRRQRRRARHLARPDATSLG